jgi:phage/conjugal plasmid C-4 type zinc finger TraR family protein
VIDPKEFTPDVLDRASNLTQETTDNAIAEQRRKAAPQQVQNPDGSWPVTECLDCDLAIPEGRLKMGRIRCVECQSAVERGARS